MSAGTSAPVSSLALFQFKHSSFLAPKSTSLAAPPSLLPPSVSRKKPNLTVCFLLKNEKLTELEIRDAAENQSGGEAEEERIASAARLAEKLSRKESERSTYLIAALMSSLGITSMAAAAVYSRFSWQMEGGEVPYVEMFGTLALVVGAVVGMEMWARWAHRALWHDSLWHMHESHHRPREGPFELNDVFAIINAVPAISLMYYGFINKGLIPGLCFGAGVGITIFGMAYMFVHDGLVHKRFPVGPIADVPYLRTIAAAHQIHHSDKFDGVPFGLFLGPEELEKVGGLGELDKEIGRRIKLSNK
ncbi:beta-carotene hydroxylase 2, chloroplastic-like [Salvia splendens]|uniref:beta-carotene hydroxylase 2, chloroplastic-like n=1 Tax=Salvia splendens TaxID=180675 RepID=UPI001C26EA62|nr:beta-carotene hydroxylase 2, chloroplastic-like [Salvia splendens]